jgi:transposase
MGPATLPRRFPDAGAKLSNNAAERALRHAVCWRKTSYGTDSVGGSRFVERVLTVVTSCRQQGRNVVEYLTACCRTRRDGTEPPSLLLGAPALAATGYGV